MFKDTFFKQLFIVLLLCLIFCMAGYTLFNSPNKIKRISKPEALPRLHVIKANYDYYPIAIKAHGTIKVEEKPILVSSRMSGRIKRLHDDLLPGGIIAAGQTLIALDTEDAELAFEEAQNRIAIAKSNLQIEQGQHQLAIKQWSFGNSLKIKTNKALATREPQLNVAERELQLANLASKRALLALQRAKLTLPYATEVLKVNSQVDEYVTPGQPLAVLAKAGVRWLELAVPDRFWQRIKAKTSHSKGSEVSFTLQGKVYSAEVIAKHSSLSEKTRMGKVIARINLPYSNAKYLLIGSYINTKISAGKLDNVVRLPRTALTEENKLFIVDDNNKLVKRTVNVVWQQDNHVYIRGEIEPQQLIVSSPVYGIPEGALVEPTLQPNPLVAYHSADLQ